MTYTEYDEAVRAQIQCMEDPATSLSDFMAAAVEFRRLVEAYAAQPVVLEPLTVESFGNAFKAAVGRINARLLSVDDFRGLRNLRIVVDTRPSSSAPEKQANTPPAPSP